VGVIITKSILIIEDEKNIADLIEYHLKQWGFSVISALDVSISYIDTEDPPEALYVVMDNPMSKTPISLDKKKEISGQLNDWS
jgi:DNA-binding response OmpR family regulator